MHSNDRRGQAIMSLDKPKNLLTDAERLQVAQHLEQSVHYGAPVGFGSRRVTGSPPLCVAFDKTVDLLLFHRERDLRLGGGSQRIRMVFLPVTSNMTRWC